MSLVFQCFLGVVVFLKLLPWSNAFISSRWQSQLTNQPTNWPQWKPWKITGISKLAQVSAAPTTPLLPLNSFKFLFIPTYLLYTLAASAYKTLVPRLRVSPCCNILPLILWWPNHQPIHTYTVLTPESFLGWLALRFFSNYFGKGTVNLGHEQTIKQIPPIIGSSYIHSPLPMQVDPQLQNLQTSKN